MAFLLRPRLSVEANSKSPLMFSPLEFIVIHKGYMFIRERMALGFRRRR
jgi:hypothetical protein